MESLDLNTLPSIKTTKSGEKCRKEEEQPLSPMARLFHEPGSNVYIIGIMGLKTKPRPDIFKKNLLRTFVKNRRFSSLQVMDKENGSMKWIPTQVNIDEHVIVPKIDPNNMIKSPEKFVEDYISNLSRSHIEHTKPLWDLHILDIKTSSDCEGTCVFRFHHSLGDGMSLMNLLLACTRKVSDPEALPTLPTARNNKAKVTTTLWSKVGVLWNSFVALLMFILTALFLEDRKTPMKGTKGVEHKPRRFVIKTVSLDDIKVVKRAMNATLNDVVLGVTQAGFFRYLKGRYSDQNVDIPDNLRFRATFFFNLRATTRIDDFKDTDTNGTWGNKIGYSLLPFNINFKKDPLDYVLDAMATMKQKKGSLEPLFTYFFTKLVIGLFGMKVAGKLNHKVFYNTTLWFSNVPGPQEEIMFFGHKVAYIAPSCYGQPNALMIHVVSYMDKVMFVLSADEETIPDPHKLCDDLEESLRKIKDQVTNIQINN